MKKLSFISLTILFLISVNILAQIKNEPGHSYVVNDSLLFDGANYSDQGFYNKTFDDCFVRVVYIKGNATGTRIYTNTEKLCGVTDTVTRMRKGKVKTNDKLRTGDMISTGPGSYMEIKLSDGKTIRLSPNTSMTINENYCKDNSHVRLDLKEGEIYADDRPGSKDKSIDVNTKYGTAIVDGTQFTCSTTINGSDTVDVLKVFEGSVKFQMTFNKGANKKVSEQGAEMKKIYDDYKSGKLTSEEYVKRLQELQQNMTDSLPKDALLISAGFQSKITNCSNPSAPESIDANEVHWWEGPDFQ